MSPRAPPFWQLMVTPTLHFGPWGLAGQGLCCCSAQDTCVRGLDSMRGAVNWGQASGQGPGLRPVVTEPGGFPGEQGGVFAQIGSWYRRECGSFLSSWSSRRVRQARTTGPTHGACPHGLALTMGKRAVALQPGGGLTRLLSLTPLSWGVPTGS